MLSSLDYKKIKTKNKKDPYAHTHTTDIDIFLKNSTRQQGCLVH